MDTMEATVQTEGRTGRRRRMMAVVVGLVAVLTAAFAVRQMPTGEGTGAIPPPASTVAEPGAVGPGGAPGPDPASGTPAAGPGPAGAAAAVADLRQVDFANFTHPSPPCGVAPGASSVVLRSGTFTSADQVRVDLQPVRYGDLTGDGRDEAVVLLACSGGDPRSTGCGEQAPTACSAPRLRIYTLAGTTPTMLAELRVAGDPAIRAATGAEDLAITTAAIEDGRLVTGWMGFTAMDPACCPTRDVLLRHRWNGSTWETAAAPQVQERPYD